MQTRRHCELSEASADLSSSGMEAMRASAIITSAYPPSTVTPSITAAPLLCAGITTYNAFRNAGLRGGNLVAVQGIGGLGHLGIQFAQSRVPHGAGYKGRSRARSIGQRMNGFVGKQRRIGGYAARTSSKPAIR